MKSAYISLIILVIITVSCSDERVVLEKPKISGETIGGLVFVWSISQKSTGDYIDIEVGSYYRDRMRDRIVRKIYLHEKVSGEISSSSANISNADWDRIESLVAGIFPANTYEPHDTHCDCCDEALSYSETIYYIRGIHECNIDSKKIEGCTEEDTELVRKLFKELKESYFPGDNIY